MLRRPPRTTRTDTLCPYTTLFRSRRKSTKFPWKSSSLGMTDYSDLIQPDKGQDARIIHLVDEKGYDDWLKSRSARERAALAAADYKPKGFAHAFMPGDRSEKRRLGIECVSTFSSRWLPDH